MKYDVFISYRREGGAQYARTIQQALEGKRYQVFLDFDELKDGVFDQRIIDAISDSSVFLLILSKGALNRCVNETDWVRQEILQAVKCGCHIVPVAIDEVFDGLPTDLPEVLRRAIAPHQFSELQMKTLFKASMEQLVHDRIAPYVKREDDKSGVEIHIETDADCDLFRFKTFIRQLKAGGDEDNVVYLKPGKYKLVFVSAEFPEVKESKVYEIIADKECDFMEISLKDKVEEKRKAVEEAKRKAEEEAKRKAEEEAKRRAEEEAKRKAEAEAKRKEEEAKRKAEEEAKRKAEEEARRRAEEEEKKFGYESATGSTPSKPRRLLFLWIQKRKKRLATAFLAIAAIIGFSVYAYLHRIVYKSDYEDGMALVINGMGYYGFKDMSGKLVIPCKWEWADNFSEGLAAVMDDNGKWGFIDKTGKVVIPCQWFCTNSFSEGLAIVEDDNWKLWKIDKTGKIVEEIK